jgi:ABC-type branched-subunit amino acid transport system ATPase component
VVAALAEQPQRVLVEAAGDEVFPSLSVEQIIRFGLRLADSACLLQKGRIERAATTRKRPTGT